jgi:hypothetical protein
MGRQHLSVAFGFVWAAIAAFGASSAACSSRAGSSTKTRPDDGVTFASAIAPLIAAKCGSCHRSGGSAPFALETYEEVKSLGSLSRDRIVARQMPPWGAVDDESCDVTRPWKSDLALTQPEIDTFVAWVARGMPEGPAIATPPPTQTEAPLGLDVKTGSFDAATSYVVSPRSEDELRCFPIDPGFQDDTWISESIVVPTDPRVVHHALVYLDPYREGREKAGAAGSYPCFGDALVRDSSLLLAWSPGGTPTRYGEGAGLRVPKGAHLVVQVHYHAIDTEASGGVRLELNTLAQEPAHRAEFVLVGNAERPTGPVRLLPGPNDPEQGPEFRIPSNAKSHVESMEFEMPLTARLAAVGAHMHWAGVGMTVEVSRAKTSQGPKAECLMSTRYDFRWQRTYAYDVPLTDLPVLARGDRVRLTCTYDNTWDNPYIARALEAERRSTPPEIRLGSGSLDEMCQAMLVLVDSD